MPGTAWAVELNRRRRGAVQYQQLPDIFLVPRQRIQHQRTGPLRRAVEAGNKQFVLQQNSSSKVVKLSE